MKPDNEYRPWVVLMTVGSENQEVARYRRRGDAESHGQALNRLLSDRSFTVLFEQPQVSLR
ncbi:hypothetical protein [Nostoc sp. ChiVER01]|uniref:hypothetical protein n=1 Tax=Nostoc sp. ChiVER01 TaxID=3075382 RepID=UPI002AD3C3C9|nr:hypothetical protein [Nostoc sp. ChiVER01]MDZ8227548.1 hypothetical protein [Nostoc sp. ChiVER01]